jgi:DNA-binding NtrC family response regulator
MAYSTTQPVSIIIADSEVIIRNVLSDYLRQCGYKVIDAASSDEVVEILVDRATSISAILSDSDLGGSMNAFSLRFWVREKRPDIEFVLAGNVDAAAKAAGELCDVGPYLKRPYDPQLVLAHIKQLLAAARK